MLEFLRRQQTWLMIIIAVIVIVAFAWLYDPNRGALEDPDVALRLYGRDYRQTEVQQVAKGYEVAQMLQLGALTEVLSRADQRFSQSDEGVPSDFIINLIILRKEASEHGIAVSDAEIETAIKELPILQNNGAYDPARWNMLLAALGQRGLDTRNIFTTVGDSLLVEQALSLFGAGIRPSATETEKVYDHLYSTIEGSAYTLARADFETGVTATDEEIEKFYEENRETLLTDERRRIDYVFFPSPENLDELSTEERLETEKNHNRKVQDYSSAVVAENADFEAITTQMGLTTISSALFSAKQPPEALKEERQLVGAIFDPRRTLDDPVSDPIPAGNGTYIFKLTEIVAPAMMELADAREQITQRVVEEKIDQALRAAAQKARDAAVAAAASGGDVTEAATAAGATLQEIDSFQLGAPPTALPNARTIVGIAAELEAGEVSQVAPAEQGAIFFHCSARVVGEDPSREERLARITEQFAYTDERLIFNSWFQTVKDAAGLEH